MKCPSCGKENPYGGRFCSFCGSTLRRSHTVPRGGPQEEVAGDPAEPGSGMYNPRRAADRGYSSDVNSLIGSVLAGLRTMFRGLMDRIETTGDLAHGQVVIITARWILVVAGLTLALWNPGAMGELRVTVVLILGLALANFFLHAQVLMRGPVLAKVAYAASAADIAVISSVIIVGGGFDSAPYVFYLPALLALSVAFPTRATFALTGAAVATYGLISIATATGSDAAAAISQMLMMAAVAFCGNLYWRIERDRRLGALKTRQTPQSRVRDEVPAR